MTPKYHREELFSEFEYYYDGVLDFLEVGEIGTILDIREIDWEREVQSSFVPRPKDMQVLRILSPRGIVGWAGFKYMRLIE